jgi:carboxylesterase
MARSQSLAGALLIHGFTGSPFEMSLLSGHLAARGYTVRAPALAGHGDGRRLHDTRWLDWVESAERTLDALMKDVPGGRVAVCGLSMGGLVTLELARRRGSQISAIALLSTALWLPEPAMRFARFTQRVWFLRGAALPTIAGSDISDRAMRRENARHKVAGMPLAPLHSLVEMGTYLKPRLGEITQPALLVHGRNDHTVPFACSEYLAAHLGSDEKRLIALERSYHVVTLDVEREDVFRHVEAHFSAAR